MATKEIERLKDDFLKWSGFNLEATDKDGIMKEIEMRKWDLQCEIDQEADILERKVKMIFPED